MRLSEDFVLRLLIVAWVGLLGAYRVRGNAEQLYIWIRDYALPPWAMPMFGATQLTAAILTVLVPELGLPAVCAVATAEGCNHVLRQRLAPACVFDIGCVAVAIGVTMITGGDAMHLAAGVAAGAALFHFMDRLAPRPALPAVATAVPAGKPRSGHGSTGGGGDKRE